MKRKYVHAQGYSPPISKKGPKKGRERQRRPQQIEFEKYLLDRLTGGSKPHYIAWDARAKKLYRAYKGDPYADLTAEIVRVAIYRARRRKIPGQ
jgi:hypothetical protein